MRQFYGSAISLRPSLSQGREECPVFFAVCEAERSPLEWIEGGGAEGRRRGSEGSATAIEITMDISCMRRFIVDSCEEFNLPRLWKLLHCT